MLQQYKLEDVKKHNTPNDLWMVIEDKVYDLTKFRNEHPGGEEALDDVAGRDATKEFIEVGHSNEARQIMTKFLVGELADCDRKKKLPIRELSIALGITAVAAVGVIIAFILIKR